MTNDVRDTYWSDYEALSRPIDEAFYARRLVMDGGECITRQLIKMRSIVAGYDLPDSVYTASSIFSGQFEPYRAKIADYSDGTNCEWVPLGSETDPWLGITLPNDYTIRGAIISIQCLPDIYITMTTVSTSYDDVIWQVVAEREDLSTRYNDEQDAYIWFSTTHTSRYWKIYVIEISQDNPRIKADLIGKVL